MDLVNQQVHRGPRHIELSTRELTLLKVLMREPGRVFTRTELCERVWERENEYDTKLVEVFVGRLRKKIGSPPLIHTIRHVGYTVWRLGMKRWPLRWKLAFYAALLGVVATIAGAATTWVVMRSAEIAAFDRRLALDAEELFRDVEHFEGGLASNPLVFQEKFVPLALRGRLLEIHGPKGELLYRSPNVRGSGLVSPGAANFPTRTIDGRSVRVGTFYWQGLTAHIGADMSEINQNGRNILLGMVAAIPTVLLVVTIGSIWVARQGLAPVEAIRQAAARITVHNLEQRLPVPPSADEIAGLIEVLNATFERLQRSFEQSVRFSAEASHHLKTPISVLRAGYRGNPDRS